ncbi:hypothetical protein KP509_01G114900 [Ceratopteris richardii]|nr:hypothetical protein KP509_01G114900 [Ceratopteris richardii]
MREFSVATASNSSSQREKSSARRVLKNSKKSLFGQNFEAHGKMMLDDMNGTKEEDFLLDDYESDDDSNSDVKRKRDFLEDLDNESSNEGSDEEAEMQKTLKVFFCSRTHSQLSQFIKELQRTCFSSSLKTVSIGSRKSLCIHPEVSKLKHSFRINERCLELKRANDAKKSGKKGHVNEGKRAKKAAAGCPMLRKKSDQRVFRDIAWESEVMDIEDMVKLGENIGVCPYYASRRMIPMADLVVLPYQSLLHSGARDATGLKLKGCVVVIDEAHNLVDSIGNMHSCQISATQLQQVEVLLNAYLGRFRERLGAGNRRYILTLLRLIKALLNRIASAAEVTDQSMTYNLMNDPNKGKSKGEILTINDFLFSLDVDNINMFKLWKYIKESNIVYKVSGYAEHKSNPNDSTQPLNKESERKTQDIGGAITSFHTLAEMVLSLMSANADGRILITPSSCACDNDFEQQVGHIKFVMLNAARSFKQVLEHAHAIILAGGTLQPIEELRYRLFPQLQEDRVHTFSCGHIVPAENVLALAIARGPTGRTFDFTYQSRGLPETMEELGRLLFNLCCVVPEGIVVFLPSFDYEQQLYSTWKATGIVDKLLRKKALFREPRDVTGVELTLQEYKSTVLDTSGTTNGRSGAVLLSIVGGKMSEGINFSDGMGRCVVMVGLPYPSPSDPELMERMNFIDQISHSLTASKITDDGLLPLQTGYSGREYYENLCMKAVNQSIGRAIRHIGDYAAILLVDARYTASSSASSAPSRQASKLPSWIKDRLICVRGSYGEVQKQLHQFFKAKAGKSLSVQELPSHD